MTIRQVWVILLIASFGNSLCRGQDLGGSVAPSNTAEAAAATPPVVAPNEVATSRPAVITQPAPPQNVQQGFEVLKNGDASQLADEWIRQKGWNRGWDAEKGWGVWLGTSSLLAEDPTGLALSLNAAQLDAKFQFAENLAAVISTAALSTLVKNPAQLKAERDKLDAATKKEGGDPVSAAVRDLLDSVGVAGAESDVSRRSRVSTASVTAAQAAIPGMIVVQTFVKTNADGLNGTVAVVVVSTPKSRAIADAILKGQQVPKGAADPSRTLRNYVDSLTPEALVYGTGATYRMNEKGDICLLGFGVGSVDGADAEDIRFAEIEATQAANGELRNVAGEMVLGQRVMSRAADRTKWVGGKEVGESRNGVQQTIGTFANALKMPGIMTVETKRLRHPKMGDLVCVVRSWDLCTAESAADLRATFEQQGGWKGGDGVQPRVVPGGSGVGAATPPPARKPGVPSGQGGGGIDEP